MVKHLDSKNWRCGFLPSIGHYENNISEVATGDNLTNVHFLHGSCKAGNQVHYIALQEILFNENLGWIDAWVHGCMDAWMHGCKDGWMDGWMDGWVDGWMGGWMDGWMGGWMDGWVDGWMDGWVDGWMGGWMDMMGRWMDGWMDGWIGWVDG